MARSSFKFARPFPLILFFYRADNPLEILLFFPVGMKSSYIIIKKCARQKDVTFRERYIHGTRKFTLRTMYIRSGSSLYGPYIVYILP